MLDDCVRISEASIRLPNGVDIKNMDFVFELGEIVKMTGGNGSGKTSLAGSFAGVVPMSSGTISLLGSRIEHLGRAERARAGVAYLRQQDRLFSGLTCHENFRIISRSTSDFPEIMVRFGIDPGVRAGTLSGGQQSLLAIMAVLEAGYYWLILDEPSAGLSPEALDKVQEMLEVGREKRVILCFEHEAEFPARADQTFLIEEGSISAV